MQAAVDELRSCRAVTVISMATAPASNRLLARDLVRTALRETIAVFLNQPVESVALVSRPGQAIEVDSPGTRLRLSVSHLPGMSAAALSRGRAIGLDVMQVEPDAAGMPDRARVALDYLDPQVSACLQRASPTQRPAIFAEAWTHFEASLKCLGVALTEWTPALAQRLATCQVGALALPENCRGAIALPAR